MSLMRALSQFLTSEYSRLSPLLTLVMFGWLLCKRLFVFLALVAGWRGYPVVILIFLLF